MPEPKQSHWYELRDQASSRSFVLAPRSAQSNVTIPFPPAITSQNTCESFLFQIRSVAHLTMPNIGEWCVSKTFPLPRYIWTPHGKHGSKLRTALMMSIP